MFYTMQNVFSLTRDLTTPPHPEKILQGKRLFRSFLSHQKKWMKYFYPDDDFSLMQDAWFYLQKYMMPLIKRHASSYHIKGITLLDLDSQKSPDFTAFQNKFYEISQGFQLQLVHDEIEPITYFTFIKQKKFPCIANIRSLNEVFCANEPDFWHEAIGHIAPLCFPEVQTFYMDIARYILESKTDSLYQKRLAVAWTLTEYGFLKEFGIPKMFGAALVGSHLSNMRYLSGLISIETAEKNAILQSKFHDETSSPPKKSDGTFRFFCLNQLNVDHLF